MRLLFIYLIANTFGEFSLYGEGHAWMTTVGRRGLIYPLMIRDTCIE